MRFKKIFFVFLSVILLFFMFRPLSVREASKINGFVPYFVKQGDVLSKIAPPKYWKIILKVNRIDEKHLIPGNVILIPSDFKKAFSFCPVPRKILNLSQKKRVVIFYLSKQYFGAYEYGKLLFWGPISSGKKGYETPIGNFIVNWKSKNYFSKKYKAPMPYAVNFSYKGLFFHEQSLLGKPSSHGCIRLLKADAKKLFYWVKKGDKVIIKSN